MLPDAAVTSSRFPVDTMVPSVAGTVRNAHLSRAVEERGSNSSVIEDEPTCAKSRVCVRNTHLSEHH